MDQLQSLSSSLPPSFCSPIIPLRYPKEFLLVLNRRRTSYALVTILSDPTPSKTLPCILEGSALAGSVKLTIDEELGIQYVGLTVKGQLVTNSSATKHFTFVDITTTLWEKSRSTRCSGLENSSAWFEGERHWPFFIVLPNEIALPVLQKHKQQNFKLPESFSERRIQANIQYSLTLHLSRGPFKPDRRLQMVFEYSPATWPKYPSLRRAVSIGVVTKGPEEDPTSWYSLTNIQVCGKIFHRSIEAKCTLSLAKPLCYTRGSVIPCSILIGSDDEQSLDLLATPTSIMLRLRRCVKYHPHVEPKLKSHSWKNSVEHSHLASWWPSPDQHHLNSNFRRLNGELQLPLDMKPTSVLPNFRIEYSVVLLALDAVGFKPSSDKLLATVDIEITTCYGPDVRPIPEYQTRAPLEVC